MFVLPGDFTEKVTCMTYCEKRNVFFAGSKDGKFRIWKIPSEWRSKQVDEMEKEYELSRKQMLFMKQDKSKERKLS